MRKALNQRITYREQASQVVPAMSMRRLWVG